MGRKTYESIGKPLPGRENWVLSRTAKIPGVRVIPSLDDIPAPPPEKNLYLIGGAELYTDLLPRCTDLLLTRVNIDTPGDTFFPPFESDFDPGQLLLATDQFQIHHHRRTSHPPSPPTPLRHKRPPKEGGTGVARLWNTKLIPPGPPVKDTRPRNPTDPHTSTW
jgi:hypothetical protein